MERHELAELHYITPIANLPSIMRHGLLCNRLSRRLDAASLALQAVQDRRAVKQVPGGLRLHDYVNLYICARNQMLYLRLDRRHEVCVLSVAAEVIDLPGVVVTDQNAASDYARYGAGAAGLGIVNRGLTFAEYWTDPDPVEQWRRKAAKCAEVLIPKCVPPGHVRGAYVCSQAVADQIAEMGLGLVTWVNKSIFFNRT